MTTLPKVVVRTQWPVDTANPQAPVSTTAYHGHTGEDYIVDSRNRKERRKAAASKRTRQRNGMLDKPQTSIYNAFRGY